MPVQSERYSQRKVMHEQGRSYLKEQPDLRDGNTHATHQQLIAYRASDETEMYKSRRLAFLTQKLPH